MDVFICTGERSGDHLAAELCRQIRARGPGRYDIAGMTGPVGAAAGIRSVLDHTELSMTGVDPAKAAKWLQVFQALRRVLQKERPKVFVGITHVMFNLMLAEVLGCSHRILVGPPEVWAWGATGLARAVLAVVEFASRGLPRGLAQLRLHCRAAYIASRRAETALGHCEQLCCLLPMGQALYAAGARRLGGAGPVVKRIGHPCQFLRRTEELERAAAALRRRLGVPDGSHVVGVFPGSRPMELAKLLPTMLQAAARVLEARGDVYCVVSVADARFAEQIGAALGEACAARPGAAGRAKAAAADPHELLCASSHALLASGTVTLEAACLGVRATVGYAISLLEELLASLLVERGKVGGRLSPYTIPNILLGWRGVPASEWPYEEFTMWHFTPGNLAASVLRGLPAGSYRAEAHPRLDEQVVAAIRQELVGQGEGRPMGMVAQDVVDYLAGAGGGG